MPTEFATVQRKLLKSKGKYLLKADLLKRPSLFSMKPFLKNLLLVLGTIAVFFVLLEITLAIFSPHKLMIRPYHEVYDPLLGWRNKPLKNEGTHFEFASDRFFHVRHNSLGLRGEETTYEKPRGVKRILLVGDSYFWGYGVSNEDVVSAVLQKHLSPAIEVINGGTIGYGLDQKFLWLQNEGLKYRPDLVLLAFSAANDLDEISQSVVYYTPKPLFMLESGKLVLKNVPVPRTEKTDRKALGEPRTLFGKLKKFLRFNTHTYQFITGRLNSDPEIRLLLLNMGLAEEYTKDIGNIPVLTNPPGHVMDIALKLISESKRTAEEAGAVFVLVFIPEKEEDRSGNVPLEGVRPGTHDKNSRLSALLANHARKERIAYLDLLPLSREQYRQAASLYTIEEYDHHWSASGHRVIADELLRYLKKAGYSF
jgi:lysophospholipase L1-like esterase